VAAVVIATLALLNYRSLRWGAGLENVVSAAKVLALAVLVGVAFAFGDGTNGALSGPLDVAPSSWSGFGLAMVTVMWAYSGWSSSAALAGEVRDPSRNMPIAVLGGVGVVIALYLATNAAYLYLLPLDVMAGSTLVAADAARQVVGDAGGGVVAVLVVVSTFGAVQAALMFNPRVFYAMASDGLLFAPIGRVHEQFLTPHLATLFTAALGIVYVLLRSFEQLAQAFILGAWPFEMLMVWSVFRLRRLRPDAPRPFRVPGYPVVPALFLLATVAMIVNALVRRPGTTLFGFGLILAGLPFYLMATRRRAQ
jgi:amino acid transporter